VRGRFGSTDTRWLRSFEDVKADIYIHCNSTFCWRFVWVDLHSDGTNEHSLSGLWRGLGIALGHSSLIRPARMPRELDLGALIQGARLVEHVDTYTRGRWDQGIRTGCESPTGNYVQTIGACRTRHYGNGKPILTRMGVPKALNFAADGKQFVGRERRELFLNLWCGGGCFDSRRASTRSLSGLP